MCREYLPKLGSLKRFTEDAVEEITNFTVHIVFNSFWAFVQHDVLDSFAKQKFAAAGGNFSHDDSFLEGGFEVRVEVPQVSHVDAF